MRSNWKSLAVIAALVLAAASFVSSQTSGPGSPNQALMRMRTIGDGVQQGGANVQQAGAAYSVSAAVATATLTKVVTAGTLPTYIGGIWVEKSTATTGAIDLKYGTGANCVTGTTTIMSLAAVSGNNIPLGEFKIGAIVPVGKDLCLDTDAATTSVRALYN